jgi:hypothetical protein
MSDWLYEKIQRVPAISDAQIAAMRHIEPVLRDGESGMFRRIIGIGKIDPKTTSFLWDAKPTGQEFTFHTLNISTIITQHTSSVFFKPSLAEVYAWLLVYMPETWGNVTHFCLGEAKRIGGSSDIMCECEVMGGQMLVRGREHMFPGGSVGHELVPASST